MNKIMLSMVATSAVLLTACGGGQRGEVTQLPIVLPSKKPSIQASTSSAGTSSAGTSSAGTSSAGTSSAGTSSAGTSSAGTSSAGTSSAGTEMLQPKLINGSTLKQNFKVRLNNLARESNEKLLNIDEYKVAIVTINSNDDNALYPDGEGINLEDFDSPSGFRSVTIKEVADMTTTGGKYTVNREREAYLYQQGYSLVGHLMPMQLTVTGSDKKINDSYKVETLVKGSPTVNLPEAGKVVYMGTAFTEYEGGLEMGDLNYVVDFTTKKGKGNIDSNLANIVLQEAEIVDFSHINSLDETQISGHGIKGSASSKLGGGEYQLGFFGPNAEEIVGSVAFGDTSIGFGGTQK